MDMGADVFQSFKSFNRFAPSKSLRNNRTIIKFRNPDTPLLQSRYCGPARSAASTFSAVIGRS